jgi:hypothetical protein
MLQCSLRECPSGHANTERALFQMRDRFHMVLKKSSVVSKHTVVKFPDGSIYIAGEPKFVGRLPPPLSPLDPEAQEIFNELVAIIKAGDEHN